MGFFKELGKCMVEGVLEFEGDVENLQAKYSSRSDEWLRNEYRKATNEKQRAALRRVMKDRGLM